MKRLALFLAVISLSLVARAQTASWQPDLTRQQTYIQHRSSSSDPRGANADFRVVAPGATFTVLDTDGPGTISHIWFTIGGNSEPYHLKRIVLRMYWDGEKSPSVETPIGDFFGLGLGYYYSWHSEMLSVGSVKALNCFFPCPFSTTRVSRLPMKASSRLAASTTTLTTVPTLIRFPLTLCIFTPSTARPSPTMAGQTNGGATAIR